MKHPSPEDLLGYMLGALDAREHEQVQQLLDQDPTLEEKLLAIKAQLAPLESLDEPVGPPPGLARRCCQFVSSASRKAEIAADRSTDRNAGRELTTGNPGKEAAKIKPVLQPAVLRPLRRTPAGLERETESGRMDSRSGWSVMDFVFACTAAMLIGALLLPALSIARFNSRLAACQDHFLSIFNSLSTYADTHEGKYPEIPASGPLATPGAVGPMLKEAGLVGDDAIFSCPGIADPNQIPARIPTMAEVRAHTCDEQLYLLRRRMLGNFAYNLGYLKDGKYCSPSRSQHSTFVLLADAPHNGSPGRISRNHGGWGQNCLMSDGSIVFNRNGFVGSDAIYVNDQNVVAPGINPYDMVVAPSHIEVFPQSAALR